MKNKFLFIIILIIIGLVGLIVILDEDDEKYLSEISYNELINKINNDESFILYIKQTNCQHCQEFTPKFQSVLNKYKVKAYYLNLTNLESENRKSFFNLIPVEGTPVVYFFENGEQIATNIDGNKSKNIIVSKLEVTGYIK